MVARKITVVQMLPDLESGGVERGTLEIGSYLAENGHRSLVISGGGRLVPELERKGSRHLKWKHIGEKSPRCLKYIIPLRRLITREKVDILHLRSRLPAWVGYLAWKSLPKHKRPAIVTTFHGFYSINSYSAVMTKGEKVIAISEAVRRHIIKHYHIPEKKIVLIHRGFDEETFNPDGVSQKRIENIKSQWLKVDFEVPVILLPARITRLKGHDIFIKSLSEIKNLSWSAVCAGSAAGGSSYIDELKNLAHGLGLANRIHFVGLCDDMPAAMMLSDVVVSASSGEAEAFGRTAVEAQAMGKPVIATAHGGSLETVLNRKTGWLVTPNDTNSMAKVLKEAVQDPSLGKKFGSEGRQWAAENFTVRKMCKKTIALYSALLHKDGLDPT